MAILSKGITLSYKTSAEGASYTDLTDLLEIPALGATPEKVDVTTLADGNKKYINGLIDYGDLAFKFNYAKAQFDTLNAITAKTYFQVTLPAEEGSTAAKATFSGVPSVALEGVGVGAPVTYTLSIAIDSEITFA
jgi:hypothetical protein